MGYVRVIVSNITKEELRRPFAYRELTTRLLRIDRHFFTIIPRGGS